MNQLRMYLNRLPVAEQAALASRCGTSIGYLRKLCSTGGRLGESICINLERETGGALRCEMLRPDVDWGYLRGTRADEIDLASAPAEINAKAA